MSTAIRLADDAAYPSGHSAPEGATVTCGYIGGDALHVWSASDWKLWNTRYRVPIWVRSNPGYVNATVDANAALDALNAIHAPAPYKIAVYGSVDSVFQNPVADGYWPADPTGKSHLYNHANVIATQYAFDGTFDVSEIDDWVVLWDVDVADGTLVMLDLESAIAPDYVNEFVRVLHSVQRADTPPAILGDDDMTVLVSRTVELSDVPYPIGWPKGSNVQAVGFRSGAGANLEIQFPSIDANTWQQFPANGTIDASEKSVYHIAEDLWDSTDGILIKGSGIVSIDLVLNLPAK
jgi:hypothetical protein